MYIVHPSILHFIHHMALNLLGEQHREHKRPSPALGLNQHLGQGGGGSIKGEAVVKKCFRGVFNEELVTINSSAPTLKLTMKTMTWETEVCKQNRSLFSSSRAWVFYQWKYKLRFKERHHQHQVHLVEPDPEEEGAEWVPQAKAEPLH